MMTDYQISLLNGDSDAASIFDAKCASNREALGLAQRMVGREGETDVWIKARRIGQMSGASGADVEALGRPWASQPSRRA